MGKGIFFQITGRNNAGSSGIKFLNKHPVLRGLT